MFCALFDHLANVHAFYLHRVIIAIDGLITLPIENQDRQVLMLVNLDPGCPGFKCKLWKSQTKLNKNHVLVYNPTQCCDRPLGAFKKQDLQILVMPGNQMITAFSFQKYSNTVFLYIEVFINIPHSMLKYNFLTHSYYLQVITTIALTACKYFFFLYSN